MKFDFESVLQKRVKICMDEGQSNGNRERKNYLGTVTHAYDDYIVLDMGKKARAKQRHFIARIENIVSIGLYQDAEFVSKDELDLYQNKSYGMALRVRSWIHAHRRNFTSKEITAQLNLTSEKEKKKLWKCLRRMVDRGEISREKPGFYRYEYQE